MLVRIFFLCVLVCVPSLPAWAEELSSTRAPGSPWWVRCSSSGITVDQTLRMTQAEFLFLPGESFEGTARFRFGGKGRDFILEGTARFPHDSAGAQRRLDLVLQHPEFSRITFYFDPPVAPAKTFSGFGFLHARGKAGSRAGAGFLDCASE